MLSDMSWVGTVRMPGGTPESAVRRAAGAAVKGEGKKDPPGGQSPSVAKDMASGCCDHSYLLGFYLWTFIDLSAWKSPTSRATLPDSVIQPQRKA